MKARVEYIKLPKSYSKSYRKIKAAKNGETIELTLIESTEMVSFRIPPQMNQKLEEVAKKLKKTKSDIIREALANYLHVLGG